MSLPAEVEHALQTPGNDLGNFVLVSLLGRGGMGEVLKAWAKALSRYVAVKFVRGREVEDLKRFIREAQVVARLAHPHIVPVYEIGEREGHPYLVMQLIDGQPADQAKLAPRDIVAVMRDAALALDYAHRQGVVHRDVKPANIMVAGKRAFVMDFGLARQVNAASSLSQSGRLVGTPHFMSPEQAMGRTSLVDARSDVYGLGATLYALLAGRPPFEGDQVVDLLTQVATAEPRRLGSVRHGVPRDLETIVQKAMEKDRDRRYRTAQELADDLQRYLDGEPIAARPASMAYRLRKRIVKHRIVVGVGAAGVVAVFAVGGVVGWQWLAERARAREQSLRDERRQAEIRQAALEREAGLKELGALWMSVVLAREGWYRPQKDPAVTRTEMEAAAAPIDGFIEAHPDWPHGYFIRGRALIYLGREKEAERDLRRAVELEPRFAPGWSLLARVVLHKYHGSQRGDVDFQSQERIEALLQTAADCITRGWRGGDGQESMRQWGFPRVPDDEVNATIIHALRLYYVEKEPAKAENFLREANERSPSAEYCRQLAIWTPDMEARVALLRRALDIMPHFAESLRLIGRVQQLEGDHRAAVETLTRALKIAPDTGVYVTRGHSLSALGDHDRAIDDYTRALEINPNHVDALWWRGQAKFQKGDREGAIVDLEEQARLHPKNYKSLSVLAELYYATRQFEKSIATATRALELKASYGRALVMRGLSRLATGARAEATADLEQALTALGREERSLRTLAERGLAQLRER